ncbi:pyridoxal-dependent decarboxylase [Cyanobium sp. Morenito 9A2]|uniref:pyridoxal phosphate-dependent decarboxylase family protein n=1 Tax=Cyanobium sp. Morenito 9A2 TaxID=2823718 RepID=UPI0020CF4B57|nr:pyridoxal-dependent decarboxylase [Cyanobium sp. Morenito 9A2]
MAVTPQLEPGGEPLPFAAPAQRDPALEEFLAEASTLLTRWLATAEQRPPLPALSVMPAVEPEAWGLSSERLLGDLQLVMEGAFNANHPGAIAHLDPPPLAASVVAELICAGMNNNLLAEELSPSLSRLERSLCAWLARQLGLGETSGGVLASGGSLSNLTALVTARHRRGLAQNPRAVVLASADAHVSLNKAIAVMGLPPEALVTVPVDACGRLDPTLAADRLRDLETAGRPVLALVATAGTTVRGAVDPLSDLAALCRPAGVWLHVDGAIGAVCGLSPRHRHRVEGLGLADSITINPQKLLGITKTSSALLLREPETLPAAFGTGLPYMEPSWGEAHGGECGLQGTRSGEILKLWLGLRQLGLGGIEAVIDGAIERRRCLQGLLNPLALDLVSGPMHLLAFAPTGADPDQAERWARHTRQRLLERHLMLSRPLYGGRHHLKAVLGNPHTREEHLGAVADVVNASLVDGALGP